MTTSPTSPTTPSQFPPGLVPDVVAASTDTAAPGVQAKAAAELREVAIKAMEEKIQDLGDIKDREALVEAVRKMVLDDVDGRVQEKAEQMWQKGKLMLMSIQAKHKDKTEALINEVTQCQQRQAQLEAENDKLRQVLQGLAAKFTSILGVHFAGAHKQHVNGINADGSTVASTSCSNANPDSPAVFTPQPEAGRSAATTALPDIPDFPFPAATETMQPPSSAPPLLLAEALKTMGQQTPQRQPLSLASTLTPPLTPGADPSAPVKFSFTLRKADGADLGLNVSHHGEDNVLRVEGVRADGAVDAWNRQCANSQFAEKEVRSGDTIVSVNNVSGDPQKMLDECRDKQLLKLCIERNRSAQIKSTTLRAEASVFVPQSPATQQTVAEGDGEAEATTDTAK